MNDNMRIWDQVDKTDPADTKKVNARGGFTAIDANSQFRKATEIFGPCGVGWGSEVISVSYPMNGTVVIQLNVWFEKKDNYIPVFGCCKLGTEAKPDEDAFKKAQTDGETKALSKLGFNHDVFQGKFDDNKYIQQRTKEATSEKWHGPLKKTKLKEAVMAFSSAIGKSTTTEELKELTGEYSGVLEQTRLDDPTSLDGDGKDHKGILAEYKIKFNSIKQIEEQLKQPE